MGTRVTTTEGVAALYDSVTGRAFGEVFEGTDEPAHLTPDEEAERFLDWVQKEGADLRDITLAGLEILRRNWQVAGYPNAEGITVADEMAAAEADLDKLSEDLQRGARKRMQQHIDHANQRRQA